MMERKTEALDSSLKQLEFFHIQKFSLTQKLKECASMGLMEVTKSFKNMLQMVEDFHRPMAVSTKQIQLGQIL